MIFRALSLAAAAARGMAARVEAIAQNIAHAETPGYKRIETRFLGLLDRCLEGAGPGSSGLPERVFDQGILRRTGRDLDIAIEGDGFLKVLLPDGAEAYTRGGSLRISAEGVLVTREGYPLEPPVVLPEGIERVVVDAAGRVRGAAPGTGEAVEEIGQLGMVRFLNPAGLQPLGANLYRATASSGEGREGRPGEEGFGWVRQGFLESSNVDVHRELADLMAARRAFEINGKVVEAADEILQAVNNLRRDRP